MTVLVGLLSWLTGLVLGQWTPIPAEILVTIAVLPVLAFGLGFANRRIRNAAVALLIGIVGVVWSAESWRDTPPDVVAQRLGQTATVTGTVTSDPGFVGQVVRTTVEVRTIRTDNALPTTNAGSTGVVAWLSRGDAARGLRRGDEVALTGELVAPPTFPEFDYRAALERRGITGAMYRPRLETLETTVGFSRVLGDLRAAMSRSLSRSLPEPAASLGRALLLGERDGLTPEFRDRWAKAGIAHILSISGLHVGVLLGLALASATAMFGRRWGLYVLIPLSVIWAYAALSGFGTPVQRAVVMGSGYVIAIGLGRQSSGGLALAAAAALIAGVDPGVVGEVSFQLSFAAMAGLVYLHPPIQQRASDLLGVGEGSWLAAFVLTSTSVSVAATAMVVPVLGFHFGAVSLLTVPATLLATLLLPLVLVTSMATAVVGVIGGIPGQVTGWFAWPGLSLLEQIGARFGSLPFAAVETGPWKPAWILAWYAALVVLVFRAARGRPSWALGPAMLGPSTSLPAAGQASAIRAYLPLLPLVLISGLVYTAVLTSGDGRDNLRVSFLDVGQGDAVLIEGPAGVRVLVDGGPDGPTLERQLADFLPWVSRHIEVVVLTHPDSDHLTGLAHVLDTRSVSAVLDPRLRASSDVAVQWERTLAEQRSDGLRVVPAVAGTTIDLGRGAILRILHPAAYQLTGTMSDVNNNSVVSRIDYGRASFLLSADIFMEAENALISSDAPLRANVLKVAHHGSGNASSRRFLEAVRPDLAVISAGAGNPFGHPDDGALERLAQVVGPLGVFRTDLHGQIVFETDGNTIRVRTGRPAPQ